MASKTKSKSGFEHHINLLDLESHAKDSLSQMAFDYYAGGAGDEHTLRDNIEAYDRIRLRPRMLVDISKMDMSTALFKTKIDMPIMIAPMAFQRLAHKDGEVAMAKAAARHNTVMVLSTLATSSIEEVAENATGPLWFQLYVYKERSITRELVSRAEKAGYKAIVVTVDSPVLGKRFRDVRNNFQLPAELKMGNFADDILEKFPQTDGDSGLAAYINSIYDTSLTWKDFEWIAGLTKLPVIVKGVLRADDAEHAMNSGAKGIVVSNHGGRQLDTTIATIDALPEVVTAVGGHIPVIVDGGIRRGTDVLKAIALGANAVLLGRPLLWGLTLGGEDGAAHVLDLLKMELANAMSLAGCGNLESITEDLIVPRRT